MRQLGLQAILSLCLGPQRGGVRERDSGRGGRCGKGLSRLSSEGSSGKGRGENEPATEVAEPPGTSVSEREADVRVPVLSTPRAPACILRMLAELVLVIIL